LSFGSDFILTLLTNDPKLAVAADQAGIDRIGVDLEQMGKYARQAHLNTWISDHTENDLPLLRASISRARLFARCNPIHPASAEELDRLIAYGVEVVMLPFFHTVAEADTFVRLLDGRATAVLLLETAAAAAVVSELCRIDGVNEIHIGLNDLHLSLGWRSHFEVLASEYLTGLCKTIREAGLRLGVGGLGRAGDNDLPIPADLVYAQYPRLGARAGLVSRTFFRGAAPVDINGEIGRLRENLDYMNSLSMTVLMEKRRQLSGLVEKSFRADGAPPL
jgi:hypothetical protein